MEARPVEGDDWLEEQIAAYLEESRPGVRLSPRDFVERAVAAGLDPSHRKVLREQLERALAVETRLTAGREPELAPGIEFDDFVIESLIGHGGMGQVFRARQKSVGRTVAIKTPLWAGRLDHRERARFEREAQAVARLSHPAIVPLHQVGEHGGMPYLVMELAQGVGLDEKLRQLRENKLPRTASSLGSDEKSYERAAARLVIQVLEGLEAAHTEGVVHRDLKPSNLMVAGDGRVRILDFGLARSASEESLTQTGELVGTIDYLAPELVRNPRAASPASDVYAVGVLLYELLALRRPFQAASSQLLLARILEGDPPPLHTRLRVPRPLSAIVEKAMAHDLGRRYASAASFASDLEAYLAGREVSARASTTLTRLGRQIQRRPALTAISVLAFLAVTILSTKWRQLSLVRASVDATDARQKFVEALLDEHLDDATNGMAMVRREGREEARRKLAQAIALDPSFFEARLHQAFLEKDLGLQPSSDTSVDALRRFSQPHVTMQWLDAYRATSNVAVVAPRASIEASWRELSNVDRFYAARALALREEDRLLSAEISQTLRNDPLYAAPAMYVEATSVVVARKGPQRDYFNAARLMEAALVRAPDHPVLIANRAYMLCSFYEDEVYREAPVRTVDQDGIPLEVRDAADSCERILPRAVRYEVFWSNYARSLGLAGRHRRVLEMLPTGMQEFPKNLALRQNWLGALMHVVVEGETVSMELLEQGLELSDELLQADETNRRHQLLAAGVRRGLGDVEAVAVHLDRIAELGGPEPQWAKSFWPDMRAWLQQNSVEPASASGADTDD